MVDFAWLIHRLADHCYSVYSSILFAFFTCGLYYWCVILLQFQVVSRRSIFYKEAVIGWFGLHTINCLKCIRITFTELSQRAPGAWNRRPIHAIDRYSMHGALFAVHVVRVQSGRACYNGLWPAECVHLYAIVALVPGGSAEVHGCNDTNIGEIVRCACFWFDGLLPRLIQGGK